MREETLWRESTSSTGRLAWERIGAPIVVLGGGLNRQMERERAPALVTPSVLPHGAVQFDRIATPLRFAPNINQKVVVEILGHGDGPAQAGLAGLSYYDTSSGRRAVIARIKNSSAVPMTNGVFYADAFEGVHADVVYTVHRWGFEQDVVLYGGLPLPEHFGLEASSTVFCVMTELPDVDTASDSGRRGGRASPLQPAATALSVVRRTGNATTTRHRFGCGYAYPAPAQDRLGGRGVGVPDRRPVATRLFRVNNRTFLSEEIAYRHVSTLTDSRAATSRWTRFELPPERPAQAMPSAVEAAPQLARFVPRSPRHYVIDYIHITETSADFVFRAQETYFLADTLIFDQGRVTFEPGAVLKFAPGAQLILAGTVELVTGHAGAPTILTSAYDPTAGEAIPNYVGDPTQPGNWWGGLVLESALAVSLRGCDFRYAHDAVIAANGSGNHAIRDSRFDTCGIAVRMDEANDDAMLFNVLVRNCATALRTDLDSGGSIQHSTLIDVGAGFQVPSERTETVSLRYNRTIFVRSGPGVEQSDSPPHFFYECVGNAFYSAGAGYLGENPIILAAEPFDGPGSVRLADSQTELFDQGASAATEGLYHFTTRTDSSKEGHTAADVGFHEPALLDTDGDGLLDVHEDCTGDGIYNAGDVSDWTQSDTDGDGLSDGVEVQVHQTDPRVADTDNDGMSDYLEIMQGTNPLLFTPPLAEISYTIEYAGPQGGDFVMVARTVGGVGDEDLVLRYTFDSDSGTTAQDESGCNHHAAISDEFGWSAAGRVGNALSLDGYSRYGQIPQHPDFHLLDFTLAAWVKSDNFGSSRSRIIGQQSPDPCCGGYWVMALNNNRLEFLSYVDGIEWACGPDLADGNWRHVAITRNTGAAVATWWVDGEPIGTAVVGTTPFGISDQDVYLSRVHDAGEYLNGLLDDLRVYRRALTGEEIAALATGSGEGGAMESWHQEAVGPATHSLPFGDYELSVFRDHNGNGHQDPGEPSAVCALNPLHAEGTISAGVLTLTDPDRDGDQWSDFDEGTWGTDPDDAASHPVVVSGTVSYAGRQDGPVVTRAAPTADLVSGLAVHLPFDSNEVGQTGDASGLGHTASLYGGVTWSDTGVAGGCLIFDGASGYGRIPAHPDFYLTNFTLAAWVKSAGFGSGRCRIVGHQSPDPCCGGYWVMSLAQQQLELCSYPDNVYAVNGPALDDDTWHHVAITRDTGAGQAIWWVDGVSVGTAPVGTGVFAMDDRDVFISKVHDAAEHFAGALDDLRIYRRALSGTEVALLASGAGVGGGYAVTNHEPGPFTLTLPNQLSYTLGAFRDTDQDGQADPAEAIGGYAANPLALTESVGDIAITLTDPDADADGLPDWWELWRFGNLDHTANSDDDQDGLTAAQEYEHDLDPQAIDTDGDGCPDGWEIQYGFQPGSAADGAADPDGDGLINAAEVTHHTDPNNPDTDNDSLPDGWEVGYALNPTLATGEHGAEGDPDQDTVLNADECARLLHPRHADTDGDGLPDGWEILHAFNPLDPADGAVDEDLDGLSAAQEYAHQCNYQLADTDGDGLPDGWEVLYHLNPLSDQGDDGAAGDPDQDAYPNALELALGTSPREADDHNDRILVTTRAVAYTRDLSRESIPGFNGNYYRSATVEATKEGSSDPVSGWSTRCSADGAWSSLTVSASALLEALPKTGATACAFWSYSGEIEMDTWHTLGNPITCKKEKKVWAWTGLETNGWYSTGHPYQYIGPAIGLTDLVRYTECRMTTNQTECEATDCTNSACAGPPPVITLTGPSNLLNDQTAEWDWTGFGASCGGGVAGEEDAAGKVKVTLSQLVDVEEVAAAMRADVEAAPLADHGPQCPGSNMVHWLHRCGEVTCPDAAVHHRDGPRLAFQAIVVDACVPISLPGVYYEKKVFHVFVSADNTVTQLMGQTILSGTGDGGPLWLTEAATSARINPPVPQGCTYVRQGKVKVDLDLDCDGDQAITAMDDPIEVTTGGVVNVGGLLPVEVFAEPLGLPGEATVSLTPVSGAIKVWKDAQKTEALSASGWTIAMSDGLPRTTVYVEGAQPTTASQPVQLRLDYSAPDISVSDEVSVRVLLKVDMAMDGNRDESIDFDDPDDAQYLFWVNNDYDVKHQNEGIWQQDDDKPAGNPDCNDNYIGNVENSSSGTCERDLEDFTRLHIRVDDNTATMSGITYWLKFENVTSGSPSVNVFEAVDTSSDYVSDSSVAAQQIQKLNLTQSGVGATEVQIDAQYIKTGNQVSPFIIEGRSAGKGDLTFIVKKDGNEVCKKAVTLELHDMPWFYDVYSVGVSSGIRWEVQIPTTATHSQTASYSPATDEKFLLVHGWNMNAAEKTQWIQTVFKRLWWQGYQGSVALFDWPTLSDMDIWDVLAGAHHFDNSEFRSWLSSDALIGVFNTLNGSGNLRVLAHSMGNVVAGEAIRRYTGADLHTYLACQSALSAHFYDNTIAANHPCQHQGYDLFFPNTPDIMGHFSTGDANSSPHMTDNDTHVSNMQNFYNAVDWALDFWEINNVLKPDGLTPYLFGYDGSEDHYQEGTDQFSRGPIDNPYEVLSVTDQRQRYMIFSYCDESRSRALGQTENGEFQDWNLHAPVGQGGMGYDGQHYSHSREFRSHIADEWTFWETVFGTCQFQSP